VRGIVETFLKGRQLDDHFTTYCDLAGPMAAKGGAKALIRASQIAIGHKNDLGLEVNCENGSLIWRQEEAEKFVIRLPDEPERVYWRGEMGAQDAFLGKLPKWISTEPTIPSGHLEAFHDAYRRLHASFEDDVRKYNAGKKFACDGSKYANVDDGVAHMKFVEAAVKSSKSGGKPVKM